VLGLTVAKASSRLRLRRPPVTLRRGQSQQTRGARSETWRANAHGRSGTGRFGGGATLGRSAELGGDGGAELAGSAELLLGALPAGWRASHFWRNRRSFQKG